MLNHTVAAVAASPFAMLIDPDRVVRAMEHSERLNRLHSRVYRPLDKPLIAKSAAASADFDRLVDDDEEEVKAED